MCRSGWTQSRLTRFIPFWREGEKNLPFLMILLQVKGGHNCFQSNVYSFYSRASVASEKNELVSFSNIWYIHCVLLLPWLQVGARRGRHNCILEFRICYITYIFLFSFVLIFQGRMRNIFLVGEGERCVKSF